MLVKNHIHCPHCGGSDPASVYKNTNEAGVEEFSAYCFSCNTYTSPSRMKEVYGDDYDFQSMPVEEKEPPDFSPVLKLDSHGWPARRIGPRTTQFYDVRTELGADGEVVGRWYPITRNKELVGFKKRTVPKGFFSIGDNNKNCDFFGQSKFTGNGKYLIICGGEEDAMAMFQAMRQENPNYVTPVISPTRGEAGLASQIRAHYSWISSFERVVLMMDNDEAGKRAAEEAAKILPVGKAYIANLRLKDPNEYVKQKAGRELVTAFWKAERYSPAGVIGSSQTYEHLLQRATSEKVTLPDFASDLAEMLNGGPALGEITTIISASGIGKSTITNEFMYHWVMNSPYKVGIIPLESDIAELTENLLTLHIGKKLSIISDEEKRQYLNSSEARAAHKTLTVRPDGEDRYVIVDHNGDVAGNELKEKMEYLVKVCGCKILILDPMTLALSGGGLAETDEFMSWLLRFVKREMISQINVVHVRKNGAGSKANSTGADIHEESIKGSGSQFQVSMNNLLLMRDKENADPKVRNTTKVILSKCRRTGKTGPAGFWYYNNETGRLQRLEDSLGNFEGDLAEMKEAGALNEVDNGQSFY